MSEFRIYSDIFINLYLFRLVIKRQRTREKLVNFLDILFLVCSNSVAKLFIYLFWVILFYFI
jgi:hypothetical protein